MTGDELARFVGENVRTPLGRFRCRVLAALVELAEDLQARGQAPDRAWLEAEVRREARGQRQREGIDAARAAGRRWGGRKAGARVKVTEEKERLVLELRARGQGPAAIARAVGLSRKHVYTILGRAHDSGIS